MNLPVVGSGPIRIPGKSCHTTLQLQKWSSWKFNHVGIIENDVWEHFLMKNYLKKESIEKFSLCTLRFEN